MRGEEYGRDRRHRKDVRRRQRRRQRIQPLIMCGLIFFVLVGTVFCAVVESGEETEVREESKAAADRFDSQDTGKAQSDSQNIKSGTDGEDGTEAKDDETERERRICSETFQGETTPDARIVYLTFDDGPSENTKTVLDVLKKYGVKATFFITGSHPEKRSLITAAYEEGHTIGLHTYSHDYAKIYASTDAYFQDLEEVGGVARDAIGYTPSIIRFPGGTSNTVSTKYSSGIMSQLVDLVHEQGYEYYDWNCSSGDGGVVTADQAYQQAVSCDGYQRIVILCHDSATKQTTAQALPRIIEFYQGRGYEFRAIKRGDHTVQHGVSN